MIKVLSLVNEALLRLGKKDDTASATGSLHAKIGFLRQILAVKPIYASDTLQWSADTERSSTNTSYVKKKEIAIFATGSIRVAFDIKGASDYSVAGRIYKNGVAVGTERVLTSATYQTYSEDISVSEEDLIQLYIRTASGNIMYCRNFRIYYDIRTAEGIVNTD